MPIAAVLLKGNIRVVPSSEEDSLEKTSLDSVRLQFVPFDGFGFRSPSTVAKADGSFQIENLGIEKYRVFIGSLPKGTWLKSIRSGNVDVLNEGMDAVSGVAPLEITLSQGGGQIKGLVQDEKQQPVSRGIVMMLPKPQKEGRRDLHRSAVVLKNGTFTIQGIAPGEYKLFAWTEIDPGLPLTDVEFLKRHEGKSQKVSIKAKGNEQVTLKQIPIADVLK